MEFTDGLFALFAFFFFAGFILMRGMGAPGALINGWIAVTSAIFYSVWYPPALILILTHALFVRYGGLWIRSSSRPRLPLVLLVTVSLLILAFFKYSNFFVEVFRPGSKSLDILLPVGISFYTFTVIGFYIDIYRNDCQPAASFLDALLLVAFWPHLASGPILRASNIFQNLAKPERLSASDLLLAALLIGGGLIKKVLVADNIGAYVNWNIDYGVAGMNMVQAWSVLIGFGVQIYADFSGYSDMAIGFALLLGFRLPANFNYPYLSTSLTEFWHRWHISLSRWFRDYLYFPLGGNRKGVPRALMNLFLVFLLSGLWHGAAWGFVIWGALHGIGLVIEKVASKYYMKVPAALRWLITTVSVIVFWAYFRLPWQDANTLLFRLLSVDTFTLSSVRPYIHGPIYLLSLFVVMDHAVRFYRVDEAGFPRASDSRLAALAVAILLPVAVVFFGKELPFIYFQF